MAEKQLPDPDPGMTGQERELRIQRQIGFASGLFQEEVTVRTILESIAEGVVVVDEFGVILLVNSRAEQMFGYSRQELIGRPHAMLIPEGFRAVHEEHQTEYFKAPRIRPMGLLLDLAGRRKDGGEFPVEISLGFIETTHGMLVLAFISDITLRKQSEELLREGERRFASFMLHLPAAAWMKDLNGRYVYANAEAERIFPMPLSELAGKSDEEVFPPETARQFKENDERVLTEGVSLRTTEVLRQSDGVDHHSIVSKFAVPGPDDRTEFVAGVAFDITDRMRTEEALRLSEARYRALYDANPTMLFTIDDELTVLSVNPFGATQLGYSIDELEGQSVLKVFHEEDRSAVAEQLRDCLRNPNQVHRWQFRKVRKDGGLLWVEEISQAVYDLNGALNILVVCQDITDRKRGEDALRKSEKKFQKIFDSAPALVAITTFPEGRFSDANETCARVLGYRREELIGRTSLELGIWKDQADRDRVVRVLEERGAVRDLEVTFSGRTGESFTGLFSAEFIDFNGDRYILSMINDITERKRAEEEIEILNTDLAARAIALESANRELEAFSYSVSHDLRKPLTVINGYCQIIRELCSAHLNEQCLDYLQEINDGTQRMNELIDALLKFSQLSHLDLRREEVDLSALARDIAAGLKLTGMERRCDFRIADEIAGYGDPKLLRMVLENLLGNAWKYTGEREEAVIEFGTAEADGKPAFFVRDNGAGFAGEDAAKLFLPFRRLHGPGKFKGFGVGLATVERIIRRHGGKVWAEGEPGKGATFYFTLG